MWIATNRGFLSIVTADHKRLPKAAAKAIGGEWPLCVRARSAAHLKTLFPGYKVYQFPGRDYPARIFIGANTLAELMAREVRSIDYANFKSSVKDDELHDAYMGIWSVMHRYQHGYYKRKPYSPLQQREFAWGRGVYDGRPFNEQVPDDIDDDEACTTPGCTDMNPCLDCIIDAMRDDPRSDEELQELADEKHEAQVADNTLEDYMGELDDGKPRYGDFDTGDDRDDDSDASSYRRVGP